MDCSSFLKEKVDMRIYLLFLFIVLLTGCAVKYTDNENNETIVGCFLIKQKTEDPVITQIKTLGLAVEVGKYNGITVGYKNNITVTPTMNNTVYDVYYDSSKPFSSRLTTFTWEQSPY